MKAPLDTALDIETIFGLLPITYPKTLGGSPIQINKSREKVPYFGLEGIIISARYPKKVRGARVSDKFMSNVISTDLQVCKKNIHLKVSGCKLQLTGALSEEMGNAAFSTLCWHVNSIQSHISHIGSLSDEDLEKVRQWIFTTTCGVPMQLAIGEVTYEVKEMTSEMVESIPENVDKRAATFFLLYAADFRYGMVNGLHAYANRINEIITFARSSNPRVCKSEVHHGYYSVSNGVYNYSIGVSVICSKLAEFMLERGLSASFQNWHSRSTKVCIPIFGATADTKVLPDGTPKISAHRFTINPSGTIRQTSPTSYSEAVDAYHTIAEVIKQFLISIGTLQADNADLQITAVEGAETEDSDDE